MPHKTDVHVGRRLREARIAQGLSQTALGQELGVSFQQIQKYERGLNRIGSSRLWDVSNILGVPVSYFFEGLAVPEGSRLGGGEPAAPLSQRALETARALDAIESDEVKSHLHRLVKAFGKTG